MKRIFYYLITLALMSMLAYVGCGPKDTAPPRERETKPIEARSEKVSQDDWQKTITEAKKEGELSIYTSASPEVRNTVARKFKETFGITTTVLTVGGASELMERIPREYQAGIFNVDVVVSGRSPMVFLFSRELIRPLKDVITVPEVLDGSKWVQGAPPFWGGNYQVWFAGGINSGIWVNTDLMAGSEIKEYNDLLKPQYKGKILFGDPTIVGAGTIWFRNYLPVLGEGYMKALVKQDPLVSRDRRLLVEWLARGRYPLLLAGNLDELLQFKKLGTPIKGVATREGEYIHAGSNGLAMATRAPHPNAAKVFANWLLTKEGQTAYSEALLVPSFRVDIPTAHLDPTTVPKPGKVYLSEPPEVLAKSAEYIALAKQIFAPLFK